MTRPDPDLSWLTVTTTKRVIVTEALPEMVGGKVLKYWLWERCGASDPRD